MGYHSRSGMIVLKKGNYATEQQLRTGRRPNALSGYCPAPAYIISRCSSHVSLSILATFMHQIMRTQQQMDKDRSMQALTLTECSLSIGLDWSDRSRPLTTLLITGHEHIDSRILHYSAFSFRHLTVSPPFDFNHALQEASINMTRYTR
jgi:hypothetical protein